MKKVLKSIAIIIGALLGLVLVVVVVMNLIALSRLNRQYAISIEPVVIPEDESAQARGEHLVRAVSVCTGCHGEDPLAPNLTQGGELIGWTEEDFFTLMLTGVHPTGRRISTVMPWESFRNMTDTELGAIWRYLQELPALPNNE